MEKVIDLTGAKKDGEGVVTLNVQIDMAELACRIGEVFCGKRPAGTAKECLAKMDEETKKLMLAAGFVAASYVAEQLQASTEHQGEPPAGIVA
jgi:hypothetical protein